MALRSNTKDTIFLLVVFAVMIGGYVFWNYLKTRPYVLSGDVSLTEDLIVARNGLRIEAGTVVSLAPGISVVVTDGPVRILGTKDQPITLKSSDSTLPFGALVIDGVDDVQIEHLKLINGSDARHEKKYYRGALSLYGAKGEVNALSLEGGFIAAEFSRITFDGITSKSIFEKAILYDHGSQLEEKSLKHSVTKPLHTEALLEKKAHGTAARSEREYKVSVSDVRLTSQEVEAWAHEMKALLRSKVGDSIYWKAPGLVGSKYFVVDDDVKTYLYRDIYFDTPEEYCRKHNVSYRLRNRFKDFSHHSTYMVNRYNEAAWPYRAEFQAKFDRKEEAEGFSSVMEARFEFREESEPFSKTHLPPDPPWMLKEYIPYFQSGEFHGLVTYPAQDAMRFLKEKEGISKFSFEPTLVFITERTRQHMHIDTPWGYGPNPTQAYIVSFDNVSVYDAKDYLEQLRVGRGLSELTPVGRLAELEVEFERNVSQNLDKRIDTLKASGDKAELSRLEKTRDAFVADQKALMQLFAKYLADEHSLKLEPQKKSKFGQTANFE